MIPIARFEELFPKTQDLTSLPLARGQIKERVKAPTYVAGWVVKYKEIGKWDPSGSWNCIGPIETVLRKRWIELGMNKIENSLVSFPNFELIDGWNLLFPFAFNTSRRSMEKFLSNREAIFDQMCILFDYTTEKEKTRMRKRFKWYRLFLPEPPLGHSEDQYPDSDQEPETDEPDNKVYSSEEIQHAKSLIAKYSAMPDWIDAEEKEFEALRALMLTLKTENSQVEPSQQVDNMAVKLEALRMENPQAESQLRAGQVPNGKSNATVSSVNQNDVSSKKDNSKRDDSAQSKLRALHDWIDRKFELDDKSLDVMIAALGMEYPQESS